MYKTILLPVNGVDNSIECLKIALELGDKFSSHIKGLRVVPTIESLQIIGDYSYLSYEIYQQILDNQNQESENNKQAFHDIFNSSNLVYEWREEEGEFLKHLKLHARSADLCIINQGDNSITDTMGTLSRFIIECGIPVLTMPKQRKFQTMDNVIVAWDGSIESIRAIRAAIPLLKIAKNVTILSICEEKKDEILTAEICKFLARHDVNVKGLTETLHFDIGAKIMETCLNLDADLIVSGAWAHSRIAELIYGGVTKILFNNQQIPVLFIH